VAVKVGVEKWKGASSGLAHVVGAPVVVDAHLWGTVSGAVAFVLLYRPRRAR
jgi:membrane associated rhomboid family serine protease